MIRNLKVLGLALGALFAMSAMMASAASAHVPATFHVEEAPAKITANQIGIHKFTVTGQTVSCEKAEFHGTTSVTTTTGIKIVPTYSNCTGAGLPATVTGFGNVGEAGKCWYTLAASGTADLECNGGDVTVDAGPCVVHIPPQHFPSGVTYHTGLKNGVHDLTITLNITGITSTHTDGFLCPFGSSGHNAEGVLEGEATATAETDPGNEPLGITQTPTEP